MKRLITAIAGGFVLAAPAAALLAAPTAPAAPPVEARAVRLLEQHCGACHSGDKPKGGLSLASREGLLKGGAGGPAVTAARPERSRLLAAVNYRGLRMPPRGKLPAAEIDLLTRWVKAGAPWPQGVAAAPAKHAPPQVTPETMRFWSFQPPRLPAAPRVRRSAWVRTPVDALILRRLEAAGLAPNPPADRPALLRRAAYDLTGLPPTPEETAAFLADRAPDAWEKVIDRLLASPRYGEKWGRHWLDLVRFAESNSYERDGTKPDAWRYRDYVIRSFNEDRPYDRFVTEQLAGDELEERTPERLIATGYYRLGLWDDEPVDAKQAHYDDLDDIVSTTGQVFLGLTVGCARCHDHKLDPLPQKDYYRLLSFFAGVRRYGVRSNESVIAASLRSIAPAAEQERHRQAVEAHRAKQREVAVALNAIEALIQSDLQPVEKEEWRTETARLAIVRKRVPRLVSEAELARYMELRGERRRLERSQPAALDTALCVTEVGRNAPETRLLQRGSPQAPGDVVEPGFPSVLSPPAPEIRPTPHGDTSGRRLALARWIASPENPLTARVMVNRVWQYHFGRGIVRSSSNFGLQGDQPTHPELLDYLASGFARGDYRLGALPTPAAGTPWSLKSLHRLIMLSSTYRMSSRAHPRALARDPENQLLWRFDMRRLQAEEVRDSILAVNGSLNLEMGGPSFYPTIPAEVLAGQSRPGENWGRSSAEEQRRRSVYIFVKRSLVAPIIASFDGPETDFTCPVRFATTQPTQALGMLNSAFAAEQAAVFAAHLKQHAGESTAAQVRLCLRRTLQREPTPAEVTRGVKLIEGLRRDERMDADQALTHYCLVALNLNEFLYLD